MVVHIDFADGNPGVWNASLEGGHPKLGNRSSELGLDPRLLRDRMLQIVAFVTDINPHTNRLSHRILIEQQQQQQQRRQEVQFEVDSQTPGESAVFTTLVLFE